MTEGKDITVITATIQGREAMLAECMESVSKQTLPPLQHLVICDATREGVAATRNRMIQAATTEWIAILDDDDLMYPDHLDVLASNTENADIIYPDCEAMSLQSNGRWVKRPLPWFQRDFEINAVKHSNYIPVTVLARRELLLEVPFLHMGAADWNLWIRAYEHGAKFRHVPKITWCYRWHPGSGASGGCKRS